MPLIRIEHTRLQCIKCEHRIDRWTCKAFPEKIPMGIKSGIQRHDEVLEGQEGSYIYVPLEKYRQSELKRAEKDKLLIVNFEANKKKLAELVLEVIATSENFKLKNFDSILFRGSVPLGGMACADFFLFPESVRINLFDIDQTNLRSQLISVARDLTEALIVIHGYNRGIHLMVYADGHFDYINTMAEMVEESVKQGVVLEKLSNLWYKVLLEDGSEIKVTVGIHAVELNVGAKIFFLLLHKRTLISGSLLTRTDFKINNWEGWTEEFEPKE